MGRCDGEGLGSSIQLVSFVQSFKKQVHQLTGRMTKEYIRLGEWEKERTRGKAYNCQAVLRAHGSDSVLIDLARIKVMISFSK